jgi:hypothetical protein
MQENAAHLPPVLPRLRFLLVSLASHLAACSLYRSTTLKRKNYIMHLGHVKVPRTSLVCQPWQADSLGWCSG